MKIDDNEEELKRRKEHFQVLRKVFENEEIKKVRKVKKQDNSWIRMGCNKVENEEERKERSTGSKQGIKKEGGGDPQLDQIQKKPKKLRPQIGRGEETKTGDLVGQKGIVGVTSMATRIQPRPIGKEFKDEIDPKKNRIPLGPNYHSNEGIDKDQINRLKSKFLDKNMTSVANHSLRKKDWNN